MNRYDEQAATLQRMNRESEGDKGDSYTDEEVRRSVVYCREDITMMASYLSSLNEQLLTIRRLLWSIATALALLTLKALL